MNINRRSFIKKASALTAGSFAIPFLSKASDLSKFFPEAMPVGIQLFTVFERMNADPKATLEKIAAISYKEIESTFSTRGGYYGYNQRNLKNWWKIWG